MSPGAVCERIEAITRQEHTDLIRFIQQYTQSPSVAEDVLQETYLEAIKYAESIDHPERILSWIKTVAKRLAIEEIEKQERIIKKYQMYLSPSSVSFEDDIVERIVLAEMLSKILRNYPPFYAIVIRYRYSYGLTYARIAEKLGITPAAARQINSRIIRRLRNKMKEDL